MQLTYLNELEDADSDCFSASIMLGLVADRSEATIGLLVYFRPEEGMEMNDGVEADSCGLLRPNQRRPLAESIILSGVVADSASLVKSNLIRDLLVVAWWLPLLSSDPDDE